MSQEAKTRPAPFDQTAWLATVDSARKTEAQALLTLFQQATGWEPRLWGPSIVGFGSYAYRYESGHSGETAATGFSPRKAELVVYILPGYADFGPILARLGPHRLGKSCLYIKRLERIDASVLIELIRAGLDDLGKRWPLRPT